MRVPHLQAVIDSLMKQTYRPNLIVNLPYWSNREDCPYPLPQLRGDHGPITKLYPVLREKRDPETLIIIVDYVHDRVETLVRAAQKHPEATIGSWWNFFGFVRSPKNWVRVSVLEGTSGCIYRRRFFSNDLIDYGDALKELVLMDDAWISGYLVRSPHARSKRASVSVQDRTSH